MTLSQSELSFLKKMNLFYSEVNSTLKIISTNKEYKFREIDRLEVKKQKIIREYNPGLIQRLIPFFKYLDYSYYNKKNEFFMKGNVFIILKNNYRLLVSSNTNFDLITTSKIIKKINTEINTPFKYRV